MRKLLLLTILFLPLVAKTEEIDGIFYSLNGDTKEASVTYRLEYYEIAGIRRSRHGYYEDETISIPSTINYNGQAYKVTGIHSEAFRDCINLRTITIPNTVTWIGNPSNNVVDSSSNGYSFYGCTSLESINIGNSITFIGPRSFTNCISLKSVTIGNSVTIIGPRAFAGCTNLISIDIPNSVTDIYRSAFHGCTSLETISIGLKSAAYNP